jgi:predicted MFS family arabinose efflux permease
MAFGKDAPYGVLDRGSSIGLGTLAMPPLAIWLIATLGWRSAYLALGSGAAVAGMVAALAIESEPSKRGQNPDGLPSSEAGPCINGERVLVRDVLRSHEFLGLYLGCLVGSIGAFIRFVHLALTPLTTECPRRALRGFWVQLE